MGTKPQTTDASNADTLSKGMRSMVDFAEAIMIDLPIAAAKRLLARTDERELNEAGWKAYDAVVQVANNATSRVYSNSAFGRAAAGAMEFAVRVQRLNVALSGAIFANLWPAIGLPAAAEVEAIRQEVSALRSEIADARAIAGLAVPAELRDRHEHPRFDVETAMMATSGVFQRPMYAGWTMPEARETGSREVKPNVSN
ncbi:MAG TPA: hypothetical protein VNF27_04070 [Candidatus Binataceae bacterium]|nr:hypothetical protein [Candidatus Binataceae bacterium]